MQSQLLPVNWQLADLRDISSDISYGYTASATSEPTGVKLLRITDIQNNTVNWPNVPNCKIEPEKVGKYRLKPSDLVFARTGATVGKSYLLKGEIPESVYASYLIRVRCLEGVSIEFLANYFQSQYYWRQITDFSAGIGQPNVNGTKLKNLSVPLPPLAEQKAIADKLDTLLAQVEATQARLERIPQILKRFRQSVLAAAVSGKLTEEWRERNDILSSEWRISSVGDVAIIATGKTPSRKESSYWEGGDTPWLTSASTGKIYVDSAEQFVTQQAVRECSLKIFPPGTLLLAMYGEGKTRGQVTELGLSATCNQACAAVIADETKVLRSYLKLRLLENYEETRKAAAGGAQPNLNLNKVRAISILVPNKDEQTEIVRRVDELFAHADRIEQQVNNALARVNNLTQSILAKAFRGELTEQWRKDNPELISGENSAEALLKRIQAERAAAAGKKKPRKVVKKAAEKNT